MNRLLRSALLDAPVEQVWPLLRSFGGWETWHPSVTAGRLEGSAPAAIGSARTLRLDSGVEIREQLIALSDREMMCTWCLVEASVPLDPYVVTVRLRRVTHEARSFVEWRCSARGSASRQRASGPPLRDVMADAALSGLRARFQQSTETRRPAVFDRSSQTGVATVVERTRDRRSGSSVLLRGQDGVIEAAAIVVERHGGPEVFRSRAVAVAEPGPGEIRIRHAYVGVNMIDVHGRSGAFGLETLPAVPGMEGAGTILDVGPGVTGFRTGDRVVYAGQPPGAYAEVRNLPADIAVPLPRNLDERLAAASFLKGITADLLLHDVHPLHPGELILVHAAAGGLGVLLCAWARILGAIVVGVVSSDRKVEAAASAGCEAVIVSSREDVAAVVREITRGRGVDVVFDPIGRATFEVSRASLKVGGHLVSFGQVSGPVEADDLDGLAGRQVRLSRPNFAQYTDSAEILRRRAHRLSGVLQEGSVRPVIDSEWPLSQAAEAHRRLESRRSIGSVLLRI